MHACGGQKQSTPNIIWKLELSFPLHNFSGSSLPIVPIALPLSPPPISNTRRKPQRADNQPTHRASKQSRRRPDIIIVIRAITFWRARANALPVLPSKKGRSSCSPISGVQAGPSPIGQLLRGPAGFCTYDESEGLRHISDLPLFATCSAWLQ